MGVNKTLTQGGAADDGAAIIANTRNQDFESVSGHVVITETGERVSIFDGYITNIVQVKMSTHVISTSITTF